MASETTTDSGREGMSVLILSADVAGGHDAAARSVRQQLLQDPRIARVETINGIQACGRFVHWLVRDVYHFQITKASQSYGPFISFADSRVGTWMIRWFAHFVGGRQIARAIRKSRCDVVVSVYPVITAAIDIRRRRRQIRQPVISLTTDADPIALSGGSGIDELLVSTPGDVGRIRARNRRQPIRAIAPPVDQAFFDHQCKFAARRGLDSELGLVDEQRRVVLVSGGGWAVGAMEDVVATLAAFGGVRLLVLCAHNDELRERICERWPQESGAPVTALSFRSDMPQLIAASDVVVHTAAGVTGFETMAARRPLVIMQPIPGHGVRSTCALEADGLAMYARTTGDAARMITGATDVEAQHAEQCERAARVFLATEPAEAIAGIVPRRRVAHRTRTITRRVATSMVSLIIVLGVASEGERSNNALAHGVGTRAHKLKCVPFHHGWFKHHDHAAWYPNACD